MKNAPTIPAEFYGSAIAGVFVDQLFAAKDQATALRALTQAILNAFDHDNTDALEAIAGGFACHIINILERGRDAIRADGPFMSEAEFEGGE